MCWSYRPWAKKGILSFHSSHSTIVRRAITPLCLESALKKSRHHEIQNFDAQVSKLLVAGYSRTLITAVDETLLQKCKQSMNTDANDFARKKRALVVVPYIHEVSHNLKKVS